MKILFISFWLFVQMAMSTQRLHAQLVDVPQWCYAAIVSTPATYDFGNKQYEQGLSVHAFLIALNGSLEHKGLFFGKTNSLSTYLGFGLSNLFAIQYGFKGSVRVRSDLALFNKDSPALSDWTKKGHLRDGMILTLLFEVREQNNNYYWLVGIGAGVYF